MVFIVCSILGVVSYSTLPISLLPDIPIPQITIKCSGSNMSAREMENSIIKPVRLQVSQINSLRDIKSETRDGTATITLKFEYGTNTDLAFIEVNEKIDATMNSFPQGTSRPRVIKASSTDLPVFYINLSLKSDKQGMPVDEEKFLELSDFAENVVKRRFEQLPEVAMADMTGLMYRNLKISPDFDKMESANLNLNDIEQSLFANNIEPGSMIVRQGRYHYNVKFSSVLRTLDDVKNIYIEKNERIFQLKDFADVEIVKKNESGISLVDGKRAITLAIIKQSDETIQSLRKSMDVIVNDLEHSFPDIEFTINRNQTELLDFTINNLQQNLTQGFILVFIVALFFLGNLKFPIINGIVMIVALIISFIFFRLFHQSINIITLAGLILALGNMMDSSIVVSDIITQYVNLGYLIDDACEKGVNEVILPIFSSTLTSIAIFAPLIFMSGIAGAIFTAQAIAVTIGLTISFLTGILLLPVLYKIMYTRKEFSAFDPILSKSQEKIDRVIFPLYTKGIRLVFKHKLIFLSILLFSIPLCVVLFRYMPTSTLPKLDYVETNVSIDWNENIHVDENLTRIYSLLHVIEGANSSAAYVGERQYLLDKEKELSPSETQLYIKTDEPKQVAILQKKIVDWLHIHYAKSLVSFSPPDNIFEKIFESSSPKFVLELHAKNDEDVPDLSSINKIENKMSMLTGESSEGVPIEIQYLIIPKHEKLLLFGINQNQLYQALKTALNDNQVTILHSYQQYLPIVISCKQESIERVLQRTLIKGYSSNSTISIPLNSVVEITQMADVKQIVAGKNGEHIPLIYSKITQPDKFISAAKTVIDQTSDWQVSLSGSFFSDQKLLKELVIVLLVSLVLMYFILASQFESFLQPLIILAEIPIDIGFSLLVLWACGHTLNLMSGIGLIVIIGVIINDSILKIDVINEQRRAGKPLKVAIHLAGERRLRAIIMTALTSILSMVPILFTNDIGSELQRPLAIAMIASMIIGTIVSIYLIPLLYWVIYRHSENKDNEKKDKISYT
ncbi:efflux RND transporter permease subunit [Pedobacter foliorum]|nr:efflux RND transporter permease subunit [Pedobacter foliorum]